LPLDKNTDQVENVRSCPYKHSRCSASRPIPIAKIKTPTRGFGLGFDLWPLTLGSLHAEVLPWTICLPTLVLITQAVFLLKSRQTDRRDWTSCPTPAAIQPL